jgi:hypothetical protein
LAIGEKLLGALGLGGPMANNFSNLQERLALQK